MTVANEEGPQYGETWVYESIVGALPGASLSGTAAVALQVAIFQVSLFVLAWVYDLWAVVPAGTAAIGVAAVGSVLMLRFSAATRRLDLPTAYQRFLFSSGIEVVLGVLAFVALVTHLFVFAPRSGEPTILTALFGPEPPVVVVYLMLLVLWDLCYRIGTSWWAAVVAAWRSYRYTFDPATAAALRRTDATNVAFGLIQVVLLPFLTTEPVLFAAVAGHVVAVTLVSTVALVTVEAE
ncbi:hypothetical protein C2R22_19955 [Salinigranum rubrum]|uniref:Uncharacterized protein n=1 Tax=Salinigranum rubrum TaxID=755307 RepID=A0A2I8VNZ3_9EURY|nr:hypothetical protein [Salinigranum rubrum]AUV83638.1 hypothetical protein C2R22_19955 [Salinigranum rubrum]